MKNYEKPILFEENLDIVDIIAVSNGGDGNNANSISADNLWD